ncbi:MAG: hypothetical protein GYB65_05375 [Chloroflexi bacterium]|nr:hypothetical protein [Chloroflexota bacterium]
MDFSLIIDWLFGPEGGDMLSWWLLVTLAGLSVWPLLFRVMGGLPDRGYSLARAAGLMLIGFVFWFLGSLGLLRNTPGSMLLAWGIVIALAVTVFVRWPDRPPVRPWLREHAPLVITVEVLFALLFLVGCLYRAHNPEMMSAEKPMDIMFLNSIRASDTFPPNDAWLAGYAISYYYFGYLVMAMLADLGGVTSGIAFNMMIGLLFALAGTGALGVVYNMVVARRGQADSSPDQPATPRTPDAPESTPRRPNRAGALSAGVLALVMLVLMGNLGMALIEVPYRGYLADVDLIDADYFNFWDVEGREGTFVVEDDTGTIIGEYPVGSYGGNEPVWKRKTPFQQGEYTYGVNWKYSRVVKDLEFYPLDDNASDDEALGLQPIAEFPSFSFTFSDIHPHVLALPFAVLAVALALNLVLRGGAALEWFEYPLYAVWVGGMVFMNSWDAVYIVFVIGAEVLRRLLVNGSGVLTWEDVWKSAQFAAIMFGLTVVLYFPWFVSFTSQAAGILPNAVFPTRYQQFFLQFGIFLVILTIFLVVEMWRGGRRFNVAAGLLGVTAAVSTTLVLWTALIIRDWGRQGVSYPVFRISAFDIQASGLGLGDILGDILARRIPGLPHELWLLVLVFLIVGRLFAQPVLQPVSADEAPSGESDAPAVPRLRPVRGAITYSAGTGFALLLAGAGIVLTLAPDFIYLHDNFAMRMNTVFKLYYQGWVMFSLASAYAVWSTLAGQPAPAAAVDETERYSYPSFSVATITLRSAFAMVVLVFIGLGMVYPVLAAQGRALVETGRMEAKRCEPMETQDCPELEPLTLEGAPTLVTASLPEYEAIQCFAALEPSGEDVVIVEAWGGAYTTTGGDRTTGRVSALTGIPTLLGWYNHEAQWRGSTFDEVLDRRFENGQRRDRQSDINDLYITQNWDRAQAVIDYYGVDYVVVGSAENDLVRDLAGGDEGLDQDLLATYQLGLNKFAERFRPVCQSATMAIYRVSPE